MVNATDRVNLRSALCLLYTLLG